MQPHQQRVLDERTELADKTEKLAKFFSGSIFASLALEERSRLGRQLGLMRAYLEVLDARIEAF